MKTFEIRPYEKKDFAAVAAIHDAARLQELYRAGMPEAYIPFEQAAPKEELFETYSVYVAEVDGHVRGFVAFKEGELGWLYVNPLFARQGIGTALARYALVCYEDTKMEVEVLVGNEPALALYKSVGFVETEKVTGRMPGNERFRVTVQRLEHTGEVKIF